MLLFELAGELFQLPAREPELLPLFQLPLPWLSFCGLRTAYPRSEHFPNLGQLDCGHLMLMWGYGFAFNVGGKP